MTRSFRSTSGTQLLRTSFGRFGSCADDLRAVTERVTKYRKHTGKKVKGVLRSRGARARASWFNAAKRDG